jgi:hypothetical protein
MHMCMHACTPTCNVVLLTKFCVQITKQQCGLSDRIPAYQEGKWSELETQWFEMLLSCLCLCQ